MSSRKHSEIELHEFLDGRLEGRRRGEVLAYLEANPDVAKQVEKLREQDQVLRQLGASILEEPVPERLLEVVRRGPADGRVQEERHAKPQRTRWFEAGAAAGIFLCGAIGGWWLHGSLNPLPTQVQILLQNASYAYAFYGTDGGLPVEFSPERSKDFEDWIGKLLERPIPHPDLSSKGYQFAGGSILPASVGQIVYFLFSRAEGGRVSIIAWSSHEQPSHEPTLAELGDVAARYWFTDGLGFAVLGDRTGQELGEISDFVFEFYGDLGNAS